jgi:hypothetical protein
LTIFSQQVLGARVITYRAGRDMWVNRRAADQQGQRSIAGSRVIGIPPVVPAFVAAHGASGVGVGLHGRFGFGVAAAYLVNVLLHSE